MGDDDSEGGRAWRRDQGRECPCAEGPGQAAAAATAAQAHPALAERNGPRHAEPDD
ncbi:hypothetical protein [Thiorhodococcus minor]|uniref:Uncharacterized protein n=1 Tax=Thiorhodococcus minor TaxID=57489 RepID=A0A6M0K003_9GAMM|nr:hypothetical protein [Thiorhodococcus minor]NEV62644.1 hypothetical protein [Thiorhodococcus minor]